ncbi:MAG: hypothetical protein EOO04_22860, partial [Chitinophagaceae bacterium]
DAFRESLGLSLPPPTGPYNVGSRPFVLNHTTKVQRQSWQKQPLEEWIFETYQQCQKVYAGIKEDNQKLSYQYNYEYVGMLNDQLLKGGIRLAGILNEVFS